MRASQKKRGRAENELLPMRMAAAAGLIDQPKTLHVSLTARLRDAQLEESHASLHSRIIWRLASGSLRCASTSGRSSLESLRRISETLLHSPDLANSNARSSAVPLAMVAS